MKSFFLYIEGILGRFDRIKVVMTIFSLGAIYLLIMTFQTTVVDHGYYQGLADYQQIRRSETSVNRGSIYTTNANNGGETHDIVATSAIQKNLSIDPQQNGDQQKLITLLQEVAYRHLCKSRTPLQCYENIELFTGQAPDPVEFQTDKESIFSLTYDTLHEMAHRVYKNRIFLLSGISPLQATVVEEVGDPGLFLAGDVLYLDPTKADSGKIGTLSQVVGIPINELSTKYELRTNRNVDILDRLPIDIVRYVENYMTAEKKEYKQRIEELSDEIALLKQSENTDDILRARELRENLNNLSSEYAFPFIKFEDNAVRKYPEGAALSQITGYVNAEGKGNYGIEGFLNEQLAGSFGEIQGRKDSLGRPIRNLDESESRAVRGVDVYLTIDRNIQNEVYRLLEKYVPQFQANAGSAVVMDPKTGRILSMVSYPSFESERPGNVYDIQRFDTTEYRSPLNAALGKPLFVEDLNGNDVKTYEGQVKRFKTYHDEDAMGEVLEDQTKQKYVYENGLGLGAYQNQSISSLYEPGSIFKPLTVAMGIDAGEIMPDDRYQDDGKITIDQFTITNVDQEKCGGLQTYRNALNFSCNVGMVRISQALGKSIVYNYLKDFGFDEVTGISLDGELSGTLPTFELWSRAQQFTISYGIGLQSSLLQMAAAYGVLANGGVYMQPHVVHAKKYPNGEVINNVPQPLRRVISEKTSKLVTAMLTEGVEVGFAKNAAVEGYQIAGKTGTSKIARRGGYEPSGVGRTYTSFAGYGPSSDPQFVIVVRLQRPRTTEFASQSSAIIFQDIAEYLLDYFLIPAF